MSLNSVFNKPIDEFEKHLPEMVPILQKATLSLSIFGTPVIHVQDYSGSYSVRRLEDQIFQTAKRAIGSTKGVFGEISLESLKARLAGYHISQKLDSLLNVTVYSGSYVSPIPRLYDQKMAQIRSSFFGWLFSPFVALWYSVLARVSEVIEKNRYTRYTPSAALDFYPHEQRFRMIWPKPEFKERMMKIFKRANPFQPDQAESLYEPHEIEDAIKTLEKEKTA
jgi:hypothetical protein